MSADAAGRHTDHWILVERRLPVGDPIPSVIAIMPGSATTLLIRPGGPSDIPAIQAIAQATWPVAYYPHILGTEQLAYMLDLLYSTEALRTAMTHKDQRFLLLETP